LTQAEAEASRARFWLSFVRLILGGLVAVSSGAMVGAGLWYFASSTADLPDLGPALVTAGGGDQAPATLVPAPDTAPPEPLVGDSSEPRLVAQAPEESQSTPAAPAASSAEHPDPQTLPVLVPDESLHLSWMEEPPIEMSDEIAAETEPQASEAEDAQEPAAGAMDAQTATDQLLRQPSAGQIDIALANLDLESLAPADVVPQTPPAWRRHAVPAAKPFKGPVIALVIDDLGLNRPNTRRTIELPGPLTLAFMTYAETLQTFADKARSNGHELLVHFPMAPRDPRYDPGPNALRAELSKDELARRLAWGLSRFEGFVGVNNHMGSGFTTSIPGMAQVMVELKARGLLYLDSLTVPGAVGAPLADRLGVPFAIRDVFIDNDQDRAAIRRQLRQLERVAERRGAAIGIGHPHDSTIQELAVWLPEVQKRGFTLVPISALVRTPKGLAVTPGASNSPG
jgi:polysaccharide deacetylase 2 family uncharacterized protein YibQ